MFSEFACLTRPPPLGISASFSSVAVFCVLCAHLFPCVWPHPRNRKRSRLTAARSAVRCCTTAVAMSALTAMPTFAATATARADPTMVRAVYLHSQCALCRLLRPACVLLCLFASHPNIYYGLTLMHGSSIKCVLYIADSFYLRLFSNFKNQSCFALSTKQAASARRAMSSTTRRTATTRKRRTRKKRKRSRRTTSKLIASQFSPTNHHFSRQFRSFLICPVSIFEDNCDFLGW